MNEDEAFIRAIVDSPGDDTPRLVYADWLDDRDDPRGPYLRAECEWGRAWREGHPPGDATALRAMAAGLDPVWVARVSRAPIGVCFETKLFVHDLTELAGRDVAPHATEEAIKAIETEFDIVFPPEYRAFLLNYNGGWLSTPGEEY
ncbi:MAG: TIGR02996 domain-containing protein, partial [Gemmataceae bacterium]|nr:TIGR02996 domain-containing protein [Gemmataceae bacterium]